MKNRGLSGWARRLSLALIVVLALPWAAGAAPAVPGGERWLPFDGAATQAEPALGVASADAQAIDLAVDLPGCLAADVETKGGTFTRLYGEGYGFPSEYGLPELPVLRRDVEIPFGASVTLEVVDAEYADYRLADLGLNPIYPMQPPLIKEPGAEERPLTVDETFYRAGTRYPEAPVRLGEEYVVRGHRVLPVEVWPVAYDPAAGSVRLYNHVTVRLVLEGSDVARTEALAARYASPSFERVLAARIVNYNQGRGAVHLAPDTLVGYLIITADAYYDAMQPFVTLKMQQGFDVTITRLSEIPGGTANTNIKAYIQDAYDTWTIPPSHVLLVGDTDTMPGWNSVSAGEITDLYYATMDGSTDWHPDIGRGRFPVRSAAQTTIMVDKYLEYAGLTGNEEWIKWASFLATCDQYPVAEGTHNYAINNYTLPGGYGGIFPANPQPGGDKLYCITYSATAADIQTSVNQGRWSVIYSGHGGHTGWEMNYGSSNVQALTNAGMYPFVASHACITGDFDVYEVYGETWVLQEDAGALVFWGSSDSSYWDEDDVLERAMFDNFFDDTDGYPTVTEMTYWGLAATEASYPGSARYYWETYNVLGDPGVKIFMEPEGAYSLVVEPTDAQVCAGGSVTSTVTIGSRTGLTETVTLDIGPVPSGVTATFHPPAAPAPFVSDLTFDTTPAGVGAHEMIVTATNGVDWEAWMPVEIEVVDGAPAVPVPLSPPDGAPGQPREPRLEWSAVPGAGSYRVQLARDPMFADPLYDRAGLPDPSFQVDSPLDAGRCHWWRVAADNACGDGVWSEAAHFCTALMETVFFDDIESGPALWSHAAAQGSDAWMIDDDGPSHSPIHAWHVPDSASITDSYLWNTAPVVIGADSALSFWHRYQFEGTSYDGSVLEISTNGSTWTDLGAYITQGGYNGTISTSYSNPLGGRQAWTGDLSTWTEVVVDLGAWAGQSVYLRWRFGADISLGDTGWYIDDVEITAPMAPSPAPGLLEIVPDHGGAMQPVPVEIHGSGFLDTPSARLGDTWLLSVTMVSTTTLTAVVPAGMPGGPHDLVLYNGDCQQVMMPDAYTVDVQPVFTLDVEPDALAVCAGGIVSTTAEVGSLYGYSGTVSLTVGTLPAGVVATFTPVAWSVPFSAALAFETLPGAEAGGYQVVVTATDAAGLTVTDTLSLDITSGVPDVPLPIAPADGAMGVPVTTTLEWAPAAGASAYHVQVARGPSFDEPVLDVTDIATTTYAAPEPLDEARRYWWRVSAGNLCGGGVWSEAVAFCTAGDPGPAPTLLSISPTHVLPDAGFEVEIEGTGFVDLPDVRLGDTWLLSVTMVSSTTLTAYVPGLPAGVYTLTLVNGNCQVVELAEALTVEPPVPIFHLYLPIVMRTTE
ncbi:MAG: IPT/TIG domain-containing protein [Anaerolineae bacterium]|nr:IPT/TIG domain-containing protein [Anaerolineae bacterium]